LVSIKGSSAGHQCHLSQIFAMVDRVWGAISTFGVSEVVRLVDERSGDALGNAATRWNPITNAGAAVTNSVVDGDAARLQEAVPFNPLRMAAGATELAAATTRGRPGLGHGVEAVNSLVGGADRFGSGLTGSVINAIAPPMRGAPQLSGYEWASAKCSDLVYTEYQERDSSFVDKEGDTWTEMEFNRCPVAPANKDEISVFTLGQVAIIACRGTATFVRDFLVSDGEIIAAAIPLGRCQEAESFVRSFIRGTRFNRVIITGHSLGGTIAVYVGLKLGLEVQAFNAGAGPGDGVSKAVGDLAQRCSGSQRAKVVVHRIRQDPVSAFSAKMEGVLTVKVYNQSKGVMHAGRNGHSHAMAQFL